MKRYELRVTGKPGTEDTWVDFNAADNAAAYRHLRDVAQALIEPGEVVWLHDRDHRPIASAQGSAAEGLIS